MKRYKKPHLSNFLCGKSHAAVVGEIGVAQECDELFVELACVRAGAAHPFGDFGIGVLVFFLAYFIVCGGEFKELLFVLELAEENVDHVIEV